MHVYNQSVSKLLYIAVQTTTRYTNNINNEYYICTASISLSRMMMQTDPTPGGRDMNSHSPRPPRAQDRNDHTNEDLETGQPIASHADDTSKTDPHLVTWDGPDDPEDPKNWSRKEKWIMTVLISTYNFISPVSSTMVAPALTALGADLHMHNDIEVEMALSIFVLAYAIGPLFFGPLSEVYGRSRIVQVSNVWFLAWNLGCGFAQNSAEFFVFRFLAGIGGSAPLAIGAGILG